MKSPESIIEELATQMNELDTIGIMLHHKVMDSTAFSLLERLIETLRIYPGVRFHTFQSLLSLGARPSSRARLDEKAIAGSRSSQGRALSPTVFFT